MSDAGPFLSHICEINSELELGITLTRDDISQREFLGLLVLREEQDKARARNARYQAATAGRPELKPFDA